MAIIYYVDECKDLNAGFVVWIMRDWLRLWSSMTLHNSNRSERVRSGQPKTNLVAKHGLMCDWWIPSCQSDFLYPLSFICHFFVANPTYFPAFLPPYGKLTWWKDFLAWPAITFSRKSIGSSTFLMKWLNCCEIGLVLTRLNLDIDMECLYLLYVRRSSMIDGKFPFLQQVTTG